MLLTLTGVLSADQLAEARRLAEGLGWRDGAETAGPVARSVKRNLQADITTRAGAKLRDLLTGAVQSHPVLAAAAQPKRFSPVLVSKTGPGGGYGMHIDNPWIGFGDQRLRTDLSFTLFLTDPAAYDGGALEIENAGFTQSLKLAAGDLVLYPTTRLHQVADVTRGERLVCVGWIESLVPDEAAREILFDLENLRATLAPAHAPQSPEMLTLTKTIANLLRRFSI
ncbi:MAG TPA: Fe2+-dependent dioxygenase [Hyphomonas sp.]|nr:Fe2+-dependent dioxygenase [Hyphomonas sp.]